MADQVRITNRGSRGQATGYAGSEAGQDAKYKQDQDDADWQAYKVAKRLSFAAQRKDYDKDFRAWQAKRAGQKKAAGQVRNATPKPSPSPSSQP